MGEKKGPAVWQALRAWLANWFQNKAYGTVENMCPAVRSRMQPAHSPIGNAR